MSELTPLVVVTGEYLTPIAEVDAHRAVLARIEATAPEDLRALLAAHAALRIELDEEAGVHLDRARAAGAPADAVEALSEVLDRSGARSPR